MEKDAYLVMAHRDDLCFRTLISMLDDERNDLYIHMDSKCKKYNPNEIEGLVKHSKICHIKRFNNSWGTLSLTNTELALLKKSTSNGKYRFYHLLSGQDLPIKTNDYIYDFFDKNKGKEFVSIFDKELAMERRVRYYYFFQKYAKNKKNFWHYIERISLKIQKIIRVKRNKNIKMQKGAQWFSITDDFARYFLSQENFIKKHFKLTQCADEFIPQTLIINSKFVDYLYHKEFDNAPEAYMRYILWTNKSSSPQTLKMADYDGIQSTKMLFARKFDSNVDREIILKIQENFKN